MPWYLCHKLPHDSTAVDTNKRRLCFRIPKVVLFEPRFLQHSPAGRPADGPQPEPWMVGDSVKADIAQEIELLATIDRLAEQLNPDTRAVVQTSVRQRAQAAGLPEGCTLHFDHDSAWA